MTRKDYIKFAEMLKQLRHGVACDAEMTDNVQPDRLLDRVEDDISKIFQADGANFDPERFIKAANL